MTSAGVSFFEGSAVRPDNGKAPSPPAGERTPRRQGDRGRNPPIVTAQQRLAEPGRAVSASDGASQEAFLKAERQTVTIS